MRLYFCSRDVIKFPTMSSYNRMLIHRVAAWFGMEHNVDSNVQCVIVNTTKATRLPEVCIPLLSFSVNTKYNNDPYIDGYNFDVSDAQIRFKTLLTDTFSDETPSRKSILKRDAYSFEEYSRQGLLACPDRGLLDRKAKSFEEREQEYEKAKRRIFKDSNNDSLEFWNSWSNSNSSELVRTNSSAANNNDRDDDNNNSYNSNSNAATGKSRMSRASVSGPEFFLTNQRVSFFLHLTLTVGQYKFSHLDKRITIGWAIG